MSKGPDTGHMCHEDLKESLQECLDVIYEQFDPSVLDEGKATDEGVPGVVARARECLK